MKKILLVIGIFSGIVAHAQEVHEGTNLLSLGVGVLPGIGTSLSYDYGLVEGWGPGVLTAGAFVGSDSHTDRSEHGGITYTHAKWFFAPRATYRYAVAPKWEIYAAGMLGITLERFRYNNHFVPEERRNDQNHLDFGATAGVRHCLFDRFSLFAEFGYNVSYLNFGVSFEF